MDTIAIIFNKVKMEIDILKDQEKKLQRIKNLNYKEGNPPLIAYVETDATFTNYIREEKAYKHTLEVKLVQVINNFKL